MRVPIVFFDVSLLFDDIYHLQGVERFVKRHNSETYPGRVDPSFPGCSLLATSVADDSSPTSLISTDGGIRLENIRGAFTIIDVSGRILHQGVLADGETPRFITLQPGVYMVVTPTERQQVLVMP